jgi:hypothetical protein
MNTKIAVVITACLAIAGCKKKENVPSGTPPTGSAQSADKAVPTPATASAGKSCAELGGTVSTSRPKVCTIKGPAPFEATFTGKFEPTAMRPGPGAVFKITSKFDRPVKIWSAQLYSYNKAGEQIDIVAGGSKSKSAQDSSASLIEIGPGETKEFVHSAGKENLPDMDTVQLELLAWTTADGSVEFERTIDNMEVRPKGGWTQK